MRRIILSFLVKNFSYHYKTLSNLFRVKEAKEVKIVFLFLLPSLPFL